MDRRDFIRLSLAGGTLSALPFSSSVQAACADARAGALYYTRENPGRWAKKVDSHLPMLEKHQGGKGGILIRVTADHGMHGYRHYIVKHQLFDQTYRFLGEKMFDPEKEEAISEFQLPADYRGVVYALSLCNKHDLWLNSLQI